MAKIKFVIDRVGISDLLKSDDFQQAVHDKAETIAAAAREAMPDAHRGVVVDDYTTDRAASSVTIRDPLALDLEAREGVLTRAAAAAGLEVTERVR